MTTNTVESSFAILKRGLYGTFHHVSEHHLQRYATEFDFKWNHRAKLPKLLNRSSFWVHLFVLFLCCRKT